MDRTDCEILKCLNENARMTASAIAARVNLSVSAVTERIHRLEERGVILGYSLLLNEKATAMPILAYLEVTLDGTDLIEGFLQIVHSTEEVLRCDHLAGEFDFLLLVQAADVETVHRLHQTLRALCGVKQIRVRFVMNTEKRQTTAIPLPKEEHM